MEKVYNRELGKFQAKVGLSSKDTSTKRTTTQNRANEKKEDDEVTPQMKKDFCQRVKKLPAPELTKFAAKVQEIQISSVKDVNQGEKL